MQPWAEWFYKSQAWKHVRDLAMKRDAYLCVDCLKDNKITPAEEVHHIIPLTPENIHDADITLNIDKLVSVCRECHKARHSGRQRRYTVDEMGRVKIK